MWPFKCKHPAARLRVEREATETPIDEDFTRITYHLVCGNCREPVTVEHAKVVGGVQAFFARGNRVRVVDTAPRPQWLG